MKPNYLFSIIFIPILSLLATNALADETFLHVQISNDSGINCQLTNQILKGGKLISAPPQAIMANDSKAFDMQQIFHGPHITLSYRCGDNNVTFDVQQDSSFIQGHTPHVTIISANGLTLLTNIQSSSYLWSYRGIANISILSSQ